MAEKMKKGPSEAGRKTLKCPHKQGINLNMREQKGNPRLTLLVGCLAIVILAGCVAKFGVIDQYRRLDAAQALSQQTGAVVVLKGHRTVIADGADRYVNLTGNPGMATGGSGDVLAGMLASFLGQGLLAVDAARAAVCLHGAAGDLCAQEIGQYGMTPTDLIAAIPRLLP